MLKSIYTFFLSLAVFSLSAQVVTLDPPFPTQDDEVTIIFDASQGNGELTGIIPVYMHSGVILQGEDGWQNVQGEWGVADAPAVMSFAGNNIHTKTIVISDYYDLQPGDVVEQLAFVFRNVNGQLIGREADGTDILVNISQGGFDGAILTPFSPQVFLTPPTDFTFTAQTNEDATITLYRNDTDVLSVSSSTVASVDLDFTGFAEGQYWLWMEAVSDAEGVVITDSVYVIVQGEPQIQSAPPGTQDGINYVNSSTVVLQLHAPFKDYVYAVGDFNDWEFNPDYFMKKTPSGNRWWVQIDGLNPGQEYAFQYSIDQEDM
ncbi:MAG: hypothetical protein ABR572_12545, partial [Cryomorphaceae bacterium]